jgi:hypothetical protein
MTSHVTPEQMIDIADGLRHESELPHLASCAECRRRLEDVRRTMAAAASVEVPEPSPLFWDHLSARVAERIASSQEEQQRSLSWWAGWNWSRGAIAAAIALIAILLVSKTFERRSAPIPSPTAERRAELPIADDPLLDLVADSGIDVDWDSAADAGLTTREGTADRAVMQLNDDERAELQRLLEQELKRSGD